MDDPALMIGFTILVWCRDSGLVPCWLLHAVTLSFASAASRDATPGGDHWGVFSIQEKVIFDTTVNNISSCIIIMTLWSKIDGGIRAARRASRAARVERSSRSIIDIMHKNHRLSPERTITMDYMSEKNRQRGILLLQTPL